MEKFESMENIPPTREMAVEMLANRGIDDQEVKDVLIAYAKCQEETTDLIDGEYPHEEVALHMAQVYFDANYREYALECLDELEMLSLSDELYNRIDRIKREMLGKMDQ